MWLTHSAEQGEYMYYKGQGSHTLQFILLTHNHTMGLAQRKLKQQTQPDPRNTKWTNSNVIY